MAISRINLKNIIPNSYTSMLEPLVKLMAMRDCFNRSAIESIRDVDTSANTQGNPSYFSKQKERAINALSVWPDNINHHFEQSSLISSEQVKKLIDLMTFDNKENAKKWLLSLLDMRFLRDSFTYDKIHTSGLDNLKRWDQVGGLINLNASLSLEQQEVVDCLKELGLIGEYCLPTDKVVEQIFITGCIQKFAELRTKFICDQLKYWDENHLLTDQKIKVYYGTSPRGIFNDEPYLVQFITKLFNLNQTETSIVSGIIHKHTLAQKDKQDYKDWTKDLLGLKQEILVALNLDTWPKCENSFYENDKDVYEKYAQKDAYQADKSVMEGWPVAMDMVKFLFEQEISPALMDKIELIPIVSMHANPYKIPTTEDNARDWLKRYGLDSLSNTGEPLDLAVVCDNATYDIKRQGLTVENELPASFNVLKVGPAANSQISVLSALDCIAKMFFVVANLKDRKPHTDMKMSVVSHSLFNTNDGHQTVVSNNISTSTKSM